MDMLLLAPLLAVAASVIPFTDRGIAVQQNAGVATDGTNRAAVWEEPGVVKASLFGAAGSGIVVSSDRQAHSPAIAAVQSGLFFIVWIEIDSDGSGTLLGRRYTRQLEALEAPFVIARQVAPFFNTPRIAFGDFEWVVAFLGLEKGRPTADAVRVSFAGGPIDSVPFIIDHTTSSSPDVVWKASNFILTWVHTTTNNGIPLTQSIAVGDTAGIDVLTSNTPGIDNRPRIALSPNALLVTWLQDTTLIARVNPELHTAPPPAVRGPRRRAVEHPPLLPFIASDVFAYTLDWNGTAFEIVWQQRGTGRIFRTLVDEQATTASTSLLVPNTAALLEDSIGSTTLAVSEGGRLYWLVP